MRVSANWEGEPIQEPVGRYPSGAGVSRAVLADNQGPIMW